MYLPELRMLLKFNDDTLYEPVNDIFFDVNGVNYTPNVVDEGYQMIQGQYLTGSINLKWRDGLTCSFWLTPTNIGVVQNPITMSIEPLFMPIIVICEDENSLSSPFFLVYEQADVDNKNCLYIKFINPSSSVSYEVYSDTYTPLVSHHFFISFSPIKNEIEIYIDGKISNLNSVIGSFSSTAFYLENAYVVVNKHYQDNYSYNITNNAGFIDDIALFNQDMVVSNCLQKILNYGVSSYADMELRLEENFYMGALFDDPASVRVNAMMDDMSYIYLARNDGKILRGSPLFWEARRVFSDIKESTILEDTLIKDAGFPAQINNGFLEIKDSIVRF